MDTYRLGIIVDKGEAEQSISQLDRFLKKLKDEAIKTGKTMNQVVKDMDDQSFQYLYNNIDEVTKKFKRTKYAIDETVVSARFLSRGLHGFRMDMLNILFLGMSLSATFGAMRMQTAMGGVFEQLKGVFAELTVGKSMILAGMVAGLTGLINLIAANPTIGQVIGELAIGLGLIGGGLVFLATLTMAAGSLFGTEGLPATLKAIENLLAKNGTIMTGLIWIKNLTVAGIVIGISFDLIGDLATGNLDAWSFFELMGLSYLFTKIEGHGTIKAGIKIGLMATLITGLFSSAGESLTTGEMISNALFAGGLAAFILQGKYAKMSGYVGVAYFAIEAVLHWDEFKQSVNDLLNWFSSKVDWIAEKMNQIPLLNLYVNTNKEQSSLMDTAFKSYGISNTTTGSYNTTYATYNNMSSTNPNNFFTNVRWS